MKCPKCKKEGCKYINRVSVSRGISTNNTKKYMVSKDRIAECKFCGFKGVVL